MASSSTKVKVPAAPNDEHLWLDEKAQGLLRPELYLRSLDLETYEEYVLEFVDNVANFSKINLTISYGIIQTFLEGLSNALDNVVRTRKEGKNPVGKISVILENEQISIANQGNPFHVYLHSSGKYSPEVCFGNFRSSSNYTDDTNRDTAGKFGIGITAVNLFSKHFKVQIIDPDNYIEYEQEWFDNMSRCSKPVITEIPKKGKKKPTAMTVITYTLDFDRFGITEYSEDMVKYLGRLVIEGSLTSDVEIDLNGITIPRITIEDYARFFIDKKNIRTYHTKTEDYQLCLLDTPDNAIVNAFVNGQQCNKGAHINAVRKAILGILNESETKYNTKDLSEHISIFMVLRVKNAKYTSATKESLTSPTPKITHLPGFERQVKGWDLIKRLIAQIEAKNFRKERQTDGKKTRFIDIKNNHRDANFAGTKRSNECILAIVEGVSASAYAKKMNDDPRFNRDIFGFFCCKGKPINVVKNDDHALLDNEEYNGLKQIIGLRTGVDYTLAENRRHLRYGLIYIMSDQDFDGFHIAGLLDLLFFSNFPGIIESGLLYKWETPIVRLRKKNEIKEFYRMRDYERWIRENGGLGPWKPDYLKGLSSNNDEDIKRDIVLKRVVLHEIDDETERTLTLVFGDNDNSTTLRKEWISNYQPTSDPAPDKVQSITDFLNHDMIEYSIYSLRRGIPSMCDGLKDVQRKIIYTIGRKVPFTSESLKVARLAAVIADETNYLHGDQSIPSVIRTMGVDYCGSGNNIPLIFKKGQHGTRDGGSRDGGQPRYIAAKSNWSINVIFHKDDEPLLVSRIDEGLKCEPIEYYPIIPPLYNGHRGMATGWSTFIPSYHPMDLVKITRQWINEENIDDIKPWYRHFTGEIRINDRGFTSHGCYEVLDNGDVLITELPLFVWTEKYDAFLKQMVKENHINNFAQHSKCDTVKIVISGVSENLMQKFEENFHMVGSHSMANMVMLDVNGKPKRYHNVNQLITEWWAWRLTFYQKRHEYMINITKVKIKELLNKEKFLELILEHMLVIEGRREAEIMLEMKEHDLPEELLNMPMRSITKENLDKLRKNIDKLNTELTELVNKDAKSIWLQDLVEFEKEYYRYYKE